MKNNIFIIYYHKIFPFFGHDVHYKIFQAELLFLKQFYHVVDLDQVYEYITENKEPKKPSVAITFDDGFTDNFVYAYPLLKKHRLKATLFTVASRINKNESIRPTLQDYWSGKISFSELQKPMGMGAAHREFFEKGYSNDFMSIAELRTCKDHFDIEGHLNVHARSFYEDRIIDFYDGTNGHYSDINRFGEQPKKGYPLFPSRNNASVKEGKLKQEVKDFILALPAGFFQNQQWKKVLDEELKKSFSSLLSFESENERIARIEQELFQSKQELEVLADRKINYLSYPFGDFDDTLAKSASKYFKAAFTIQKDIIRKDQDLYKLPRFAIAKDIFSFFFKVIPARYKK